MESVAYQLDIFQPLSHLDEVKWELNLTKDSLKRTQRKVFYEQKQLMDIILSQKKDIDRLNKRIDNLTVLRGGL